MAEVSGASVDAIGARQAALAARHDGVAEADRALAEALDAAHAATAAGLARLDAIGREIDDAVEHQVDLAADTASGASEFQRFLIAKQREIIAVIAGARDDDDAKAALLRSLLHQYDAPNRPAH